MELQRCHIGALVLRGARGRWGICARSERESRRVRGSARRLDGWCQRAVLAAEAKTHEDVVDGVVEIGDRKRGTEAEVRLRTAPELGDAAGDRNTERGSDLGNTELGRALVAGADHSELRFGLAVRAGGLEHLEE